MDSSNTNESTQNAGDIAGSNTVDQTNVSASIEVDGENLNVDQIRELKKGGLRQADYTRKTQELQSQLKSIEDFKEVIEVAKDDPEAAVEMFRQMFGDEDDEGDESVPPPKTKSSSKKRDTSNRGDEILKVRRQLAELTVNMEIGDMKRDDKYGSVFTKYESDILDLAAEKKISLRDAAAIWCSEHTKEAEALRQNKSKVDNIEPHRKPEGNRPLNTKEFVRSGNIVGAWKQFQGG